MLWNAVEVFTGEFINSECFSCKKIGHISKMFMNYKKSSDTNKIDFESSPNPKLDSSEICYRFYVWY